MKHIVSEAPDGSCCVTIPSPSFLKRMAGLGYTEDNIPWEDMKGFPKGKPHKVVDRDLVPKDRTFRNAWKLDQVTQNAVTTDMPKAKEIAKDNIRAVRKEVMERLDIEVVKADEVGDVTSKIAIVDKKNVARDATADPRLDAGTHDTLKVAMNTIIAEVQAL